TIEPVLAAVPVVPSDRARVQSEAEKNSAQVRRLQAQIRSTEAVLARARNSARDQFDFILSAGHRNLSGDTQLSGRVDNSEVVGGLQFEYRANLDDRGLQAEVSQAFIDRAIAQRELTATELDLRYQVDGLLDELSAAKVAVEQRRTHLVAEQAKVDEAVERYRRGRADTAQLIQFENDRQIAGLATDQQVVEQARRHTELEILRGTLWQHLPTPPGAP
ncbi:MAG: TolC family protein, partial [Pseudomonadota bacterium]